MLDADGEKLSDVGGGKRLRLIAHCRAAEATGLSHRVAHGSRCPLGKRLSKASLANPDGTTTAPTVPHNKTPIVQRSWRAAEGSARFVAGQWPVLRNMEVARS
jgi:hypothetical protein